MSDVESRDKDFVEESVGKLIQSDSGVPSEVEVINSNDNIVEDSNDDDLLLISPFEFNGDDAHCQNDETTFQVMITCPTCTMSFPAEETAVHADRCADLAEGFLPSHATYGDLVMQNVNVPEVDFNSSSEDIPCPTSITECLTILRRNVKPELTSTYVRRKCLWEDFVNVTRHCKWFKPQNTLKVIFIGEPAIDGGGPKREFFTGLSFCIYLLCCGNGSYTLNIPYCLQYSLFTQWPCYSFTLANRIFLSTPSPPPLLRTSLNLSPLPGNFCKICTII